MAGSAGVNAVLAELRRALAAESWFSRLGRPLEQTEQADVRLYLDGLGLRATPALVAEWPQARDISSDPNWSRPWWDGEQAAQRALYAQAAKGGEIQLLQDLTTLMEESTGKFHAAAAHGMGADPATVRAAAGAASQCAHQYALCYFAGPDESHFLAAKFRLFLAGRWPLCVVGDRFYIF